MAVLFYAKRTDRRGFLTAKGLAQPIQKRCSLAFIYIYDILKYAKNLRD